MRHRPDELHEQAQAYVDSALEAQRRSGHEPAVSDEAYTAAIERAAESFARLTDPTERPDEDAIPA
jgi:hypothetical protein